MAVSVDNTALFRARALIISKEAAEFLGKEQSEEKGAPVKAQQKDVCTTSSNFYLYCSHARQIITDITELRNLVLDKRKEYILCNNSFSLYGVQKFMSDGDRRKFDQETDLALKHCTKLIKSLEAQIESDNALRRFDQLKHLIAVTNLLNIYLKEVLSIIRQLRAIHVRKSRQMRRICRLANLVEMYGPQIEQSQKEEEEKASRLTRMLEEFKPKECHKTSDGWEVAETEPQSNPSDEWEDAQPLDGWEGVKTEEREYSKAEQSQLLKQNEALFERFTATDAELSSIEAQMSEIQRLQNIFAEKINEQEQEIDTIHSRTVYTLDNLETANEFIREAIKNQANRRVIIIFCLLVLTFTLLFLDWYNP